MGRDRAIRAFDPRREGQPLDLFTSAGTRLPVILELLRSPWVMRASELSAMPSGLGGKRREREIAVVWDGEQKRPSSFVVDGVRYRVDALVFSWMVERAWWDPRRRVSRRCFRVLARGGLYDLAYDRVENAWFLVGVVD